MPNAQFSGSRSSEVEYGSFVRFWLKAEESMGSGRELCILMLVERVNCFT